MMFDMYGYEDVQIVQETLLQHEVLWPTYTPTRMLLALQVEWYNNLQSVKNNWNELTIYFILIGIKVLYKSSETPWEVFPQLNWSLLFFIYEYRVKKNSSP